MCFGYLGTISTKRKKKKNKERNRPCMPKALNIYSRVEHLEEGFCLLSPLTGQPRLLTKCRPTRPFSQEGQCSYHWRPVPCASSHGSFPSPWGYVASCGEPHARLVPFFLLHLKRRILFFWLHLKSKQGGHARTITIHLDVIL